MFMYRYFVMTGMATLFESFITKLALKRTLSSVL